MRGEEATGAKLDFLMMGRGDAPASELGEGKLWELAELSSPQPLTSDQDTAFFPADRALVGGGGLGVLGGRGL